MANICEMNRQVAKRIRILADSSLNETLNAFGVNVSIGGGRFDESTVTFKITFTPQTLVENHNRVSAMNAGLPTDIVGKVFNSPTPGGKDRFYTIVSVKASRPKYPIVAENKNGKRFKFPSSVAERAK